MLLLWLLLLLLLLLLFNKVVDITPILGQAEMDRARKLEQDKLDMIAEFGETTESDTMNEEDEDSSKAPEDVITRDEEDPFWK